MQKAKPGRGQRVAEQIARDLAEIIPLEVRDPRVGLVTITGCEITPDYAHARVFFTVIGSDPAQCTQGLTAAAGMLRGKIFKKLRIHTVPTLHTSVERGFELDRVINDAMRVTNGGKTSEKADDGRDDE